MLSKVKEIDELLQKAYLTRVRSVEESIKMAVEAKKNAEKQKENLGIAWAKNYLGLFYMIRGNNSEALNYAHASREEFAHLNLPEGEAFALYTIGSVQYKSTNYQDGLENLYESLKLWDQLNDLANKSKTLKAIGYIYETFNDYENAVKNYLLCRRISEEIGDKNGESNACNPLSGIYLKQGDIINAKETIETSIRLKLETDDKRGLAFAYYGKGKVLMVERNYEEARKFFDKSLQVHKEMSEQLGAGLVCRKFGQLYTHTGDLDKAKKYSRESLEIGIKISNNDLIYKSYYQLYEIARRQNQLQQALTYFESFHEVKEIVLNTESSGKILAREAMFEAEMSKRQAELEKENNIRLQLAHDTIKNKNEEITNSINYASRIQKAILPTREMIKSYFPKSFVFYRPKDIVAGDFYWIESEGTEIYFAVADCTGHGVPGALVSMVCSEGLKRALDTHGIAGPHKMLEEVSRTVIRAFEKGDDYMEDGMDVSLCKYDSDTNTLEFAGAHHTLYLIRKEDEVPPAGKEVLKTKEYTLYEFKGTRRPVGKHHYSGDFEMRQLQLLKMDRIYLTTDGFIDQFGGPKTRKFMVKRFRKMLMEIQPFPMDRQKEKIFKRFKDWKGDYKQIDDVCVMGVEIEGLGG